MKGVANNDIPEAALLQAQVCYQVKVLCHLYRAGKKKNCDYSWYRFAIDKAPDKIIDQHHHKQITTIRPDDSIVDIQGNKDLYEQQDEENNKSGKMKTELHGSKDKQAGRDA